MQNFHSLKYGSQIKIGLVAGNSASKRAVQKTAEATGYLIGNKIVDKITSLGKSKNKEKKDKPNELEEIYIPPEKRQQIIDELKIVLGIV